MPAPFGGPGRQTGIATFSEKEDPLNTANFFTCHYRPEIQDLDSNPPCPGSASAKPEDVEEEEEEELEEEDDDSLAGKSQEDTVSPTPEPQGVYEDEEDEEPPSLTMGFDHTRRWAWPSAGGWAGRENLNTG
jgi:hypothetical protein